MSLNELKADRVELESFREKSTSPRVANVLVQAIAEVDRQIVNLEIKARIAAERQAAASTAGSAPKRYLHELTDYGWDQSAKYVKLFITLKDVQKCTEESVNVKYTENSLQLHVCDLDAKDFGLTVNNLLHAIDVEKSYRKIKTDMVAIYLKKAEEGVEWDVLTSIQKRLKQKQDNELKKHGDSPENTLVHLMKKIYNDGDAKTKQMISKAWMDSQEKARFGGLGDAADL